MTIYTQKYDNEFKQSYIHCVNNIVKVRYVNNIVKVCKKEKENIITKGIDVKLSYLNLGIKDV